MPNLKGRALKKIRWLLKYANNVQGHDVCPIRMDIWNNNVTEILIERIHRGSSSIYTESKAKTAFGYQ
jgi:hypothetical protein